MIYYETTHYDGGSDFPVTTAHDTLDEAIEFADSHGVTLISEIGGSWDDFGKCSFCGEWFTTCELSSDSLCEDCERAIEEHSAPEPGVGDLRILPIGFSFEVQRYSARNYGGYYERDWQTIRTFYDEAEAKAYVENYYK